MDKDTRNAIEKATQRARTVLEEDFATQLEGTFDVLRSGTVAAKGGAHLSARETFQRHKIVAAIEHKGAGGMTAAEAVTDYLRDAAFTTLNRFVALKMLEARELVQECITKGPQSAGYREFCGMAAGVALLPESIGYRLYIESLFDELSTEVKVLFDRRDPASVLWPKRATVEALLDVLNATDLASVWGEDETIGWVYQYFNGGDERRAMREASQAPRNSRELAVRNQFFTPRYVVQFLTDNTLGRIWYEMRGGETALVEQCEYLVRRPDESYLPRQKKDPRDLMVLDPACGSGHFLIYAFDLMVTIYDEAYRDTNSPKSEATGNTIAADYPTINLLRRALPGLILAHNLHGVDIDPRCAQIAQLALWMRAQRAFHGFRLERTDRPIIRRSNIVVAEPLVTGDGTLNEFLTKLDDPELGGVLTDLAGALELAGDLGPLLRVEHLVAPGTRRGQTGELFAPPEARIRAALPHFVAASGDLASTRRRLFADDATQGVGLLETVEKKFDVVLMNPPFGAGSTRAKSELEAAYPESSQDLAAAFGQRAIELSGPSSMIGALTTRIPFFVGGFSEWRERILLQNADVFAFADLGYGVLDGALVEVAAWVLSRPASDSLGWFASALRAADKHAALRSAVHPSAASGSSERVVLTRPSSFRLSEGSPFCYWISEGTRVALFRHPTLESFGCSARKGLDTADDVRFLRTAWEVPPNKLGWGKQWVPLAKGGEYSPFYDDIHLVVDLRAEGEQLRLSGASIRNERFYGTPGITYSSRSTSAFNAKVLPAGSAISTGGHGVFPSESLAPETLLAMLVSRASALQIEVAVGGGDEAHSGSAARNYLNGIVSRLHVPELTADKKATLNEMLLPLVDAAVGRASWDETARNFVAPLLLWHRRESLSASLKQARHWLLDGWVQQLKAYAALDTAISESFGLSSDALGELDEQMGVLLGIGGQSDAGALRFAYGEIADADVPGLIAEANRRLGASRVLSKKAYVTDRRFELLCRVLKASPAAVADLEKERVDDGGSLQHAAKELLSIAIGVAFGRWDPAILAAPALCAPEGIHWSLLQRRRAHETESAQGLSVLVDDPGHRSDIANAAKQAFLLFWPNGEEAWLQVGNLVSAGGEGEREWLRSEFFDFHLSSYSKSRKSAPIYWQLATVSGRYSVWLYLHAFNKDTLYKVQSDYVAAKLMHEEREVEELRRRLGESPRAAERKAVTEREGFLDELRAFLEEVKRVAPLWNPNLDDGVIINFAPLWRLVPHHKPWQKELKSTWGSLCAGEYDWSHLAMYLWPERVVPKCAVDRSLAVAHSLDEVFWHQGADGKWEARRNPTRPVAEIVLERTSAAVKAALKSLLEAPMTAPRGNRGRVSRSVAADADIGTR